jgi:bifunctional non-homologous end joining protein LigD
MLPALMHATQVPRPFHTKGWVFEEKYDGWRMLALKEAGRVRLVSRNERDHTKRFPEIVQALTKLKPATFTLDGEVAVFDADLISRFEWLRHLNHGDLATPPLYMVFDLLQLGEKDYRTEPLKVRASSGSRSASSSIEPLRSAKRTVTCLRSPSRAAFEVRIFSAKCLGV